MKLPLAPYKAGNSSMHKLFFAILLIVSFFTLASMTPQISQAQGTIVVKNITGPSVADKLTERARASWPWYVSRASGIVAAIALAMLIISGIGQVTGYMFKFLEPLTSWATHRALGIIFGISILVHIAVLLFDHFAPFGITQLLIPWLSEYKPVTILGVNLGSLWVALGVLAFYGVIAIMLTSYVWIEKKSTYWKLTHLLSYFVLLLVFFHALFLGTDLAHGFFRWAWLLLGYLFVGLIVHRLYRARTT